MAFVVQIVEERSLRLALACDAPGCARDRRPSVGSRGGHWPAAGWLAMQSSVCVRP
jgi:hypothetical protein